jgi:hypothetical protein
VVDYLSNGGDHYKITDDGATWKHDLKLSSGRHGYRWEHSIDGSKLCLWWGQEKIDCAYATCPEVGESWHGDVSFSCECK